MKVFGIQCKINMIKNLNKLRMTESQSRGDRGCGNRRQYCRCRGGGRGFGSDKKIHCE